MLDAPQQDKMMTGAPVKKGWHFSGQGIWHNLFIEAESIEEATKEWLAKRKPVAVPLADIPPSPDTTAGTASSELSPQSTALADSEPESKVQ